MIAIIIWLFIELDSLADQHNLHLNMSVCLIYEDI
jgi:hypothetical protein